MVEARRVLTGWGAAGTTALAPAVDVVVVVDVLRFSTAVDVAVARGATVVPTADRGATTKLSPTELVATARPGDRYVVPSANGSRLCALALSLGVERVMVGCLRNASAVRAAVAGDRVAVIAAGERHRWDGPMRHALEDALGAGAIAGSGRMHRLFERCRDDLPSVLARCRSGRELLSWDLPGDVELAAQLDVSDVVPALVDGELRPA